MTAASSPPMARYRCEYAGGSASNASCSPAGMAHFSSSKTKCALPMMTFSPSTVLEMPCATRYSTCECISSCARLRSLAARTTAFAHRVREVFFQTGRNAQHLALAAPAERDDLRHPRAGVGQRAGFVKDDGIRFGHGLQDLPPLTVMCRPPASRMADSTASGMASLSAHEKSTISTDSARVTLRVSPRLSTLPASV